MGVSQIADFILFCTGVEGAELQRLLHSRLVHCWVGRFAFNFLGKPGDLDDGGLYVRLRLDCDVDVVIEVFPR